MAITTFKYKGTGERKNFTITGALSQSHVRVWVNNELQEDGWNLVSSSILFDKAPLSSEDIYIYISSDGTFTAEYTEPTDIEIVSENKDSIVEVAGNINHVVTVSEAVTNGYFYDPATLDLAKDYTDEKTSFLEITENSKTGYGTSFRVDNPTWFGDIGTLAVDLSSANYYMNYGDKGATGDYSFSAGHSTWSAGSYSTALGVGSTASDYGCVAMGSNPTAEGSFSVAIGNNATATGDNSVAIGAYVNATGDYSFATGYATTAGKYGTAIGYGTKAINNYNASYGYYTTALGYYTTAAYTSSFVTGKNGGIGWGNSSLFGVAYNPTNISDITSSYTDTNLVFKVNTSGNGYFDGSADVGSADYAEYFESNNGQVIDNALFVSWSDGTGKIEKGNSDILGIISPNAGVIGDSAEMNWVGKYKKDEFGKKIKEEQEFTEELPVHFIKNENNKYVIMYSKETIENANSFEVKFDDKIITTKEDLDKEYEVIDLESLVGTYKETRVDLVLNPDYDKSIVYTPRSERPEWNCVGLLGKLWVKTDDTTIKIGEYITSDENGKAIKCSKSDNNAYRVIETKYDYNMVRIFFK